jgi:energy-converting hydrogenase Eha subunit E
MYLKKYKKNTRQVSKLQSLSVRLVSKTRKHYKFANVFVQPIKVLKFLTLIKVLKFLTLIKVLKFLTLIKVRQVNRSACATP